MFVQTVKPEDIFDRLNSEAYAPEHIECAHTLKKSGINLSTLGELASKKINNSIRGVTGELDLPGATIPMFRPADISGGVADPESAPKLTKSFEAAHEKSRVFPGDLVLGIAGSVGCVGRVPASVSFGNINGSSARISTPADHISAFLLAYIQSRYGQSSLLRYGVGSVQKHLNLEDLPIVTVCKPNDITQKYIGDKVRQAERLRAWAKLSETHVNQYHQTLVAQQTSLDFAKRVRVVSPERMSERLDAHFYPGVVDEYLRLHQGKFKQLGKLCANIYNGQTQPETDSSNSCKQITVTNLSSSFLGGIPRDVEAPGKKGKFLKAYDILMCNAAHNKTYIGKDLTFVHSEALILPSTEVMTIRVDRSQIPASYIRAYLLTKLGYVQIQSTIRGITAHSYPDDMALLDIYVPDVADKDKEDWFACDEQLARAGKACEVATQLTNAAKLLVEALIEGQLTETELIAAEQALQAGNDQLDRRILNRLKTDNIDGQGAALFSDLDELYLLLAQAEVD